MLHELMPDEPEVALLALLLVTDARRPHRTSSAGRLLRLDEQDRSLWDHKAIAEAHDQIASALRSGPPALRPPVGDRLPLRRGTSYG
jgi:RNA polymerase sigma-70 factor (ECF subfamily)